MAGRTTRELALHRTGRSRTRRRIVAATTAGMLLLGSAAFADSFVPDPASTSVAAGATTEVTVTLVGTTFQAGPNIIEQCELTGSLQVDTSVATADASIATAAWKTNGIFDDCGDQRILVVTGVAAGGPINITVSADYDSANTSEGVSNSNSEFIDAVIAVTVTGGNGEPPPVMELVCSNPAAPAWAAHILRENGLKSGSKDFKNYVAQVAHFMGPQTDFNDVEKDPAGTWANDEAMKTAFELQNRIYGEAVYDWLDDDADPSLTLYVPFNDIDGPSTSCVEVEVTPED